MNYLCLDYGTKRIGVAFATTPIAEPLQIVPNSVKQDEVISPDALDRLARIVHEYMIDQIVVGISEGKMAEKSHAFALILRKKFELLVEEADETLSSKEAFTRSKTMKKSKRRAPQDHLAATLILQDYLDLHVKEY